MAKQKIKKQKSLRYLKESETQIWIIVGIFALSILFGIINANVLEKIINPLLKEIVEQTKDLTGLSLIIFIFTNNVLTSLYSLVLGVFLGILPIFTALINGIILGYVINKTTTTISILEIWRLFPHGIFELPAVFISLGLGLKLGYTTLKNYLKNKKNIGMQVLGILSLVIGIIGMVALKTAFFLITRLTRNEILSSLHITAGILYLMIGLSLLLPFFLLFFILDKKIRRFNFQNINSALKIFLVVVIPLLMIAAIIEGLLITLL